MEKLKQRLKYTPPDFRFFQRYGFGILHQAQRALDAGLSAIDKAEELDVAKYQTWKINRGFSPDLVDVYAFWAMADDMLARLNSMKDPKERDKHIALDVKHSPKLSLEKAMEEFAELTGKIAVLEVERGKEYLYPALNRQLEERIAAWKEILAFAENNPEDDFCSDEPMEDWRDCCRERLNLEYARDGIHMLRFAELETAPEGFKRLEPLPYYDTFVDSVPANDDQFRKLLHGRKLLAPWADPIHSWFCKLSDPEVDRSKE